MSTKLEAIQALERGYAVSHKNFTNDEFIKKESGELINQDGTNLIEDEFWIIRSGGHWETNWEIYNTTKLEDAKLYLKSFHGLDVEHSMSAKAFEYDIYDRNRIGDDVIDDWYALTKEEVIEIAEELKAKSLPQPDSNEGNLNDLPVTDTLEDERFPNGFDNWQETHFEICEAITQAMSNSAMDDNVAKRRHEEQGRGGLYELAEELTTKFEKENENVEWGIDTLYLDTIDEFIQREIFTSK